MNKNTTAIHPGEILGEVFLADYDLTQYQLAKALKIPQSRLTEIIKGRRSITADTAARLGRYFRTTAEYWLNLQAHYDLRSIDAKKIEKEVQPRAA
jgi:addiction module HigA family antidote